MNHKLILIIFLFVAFIQLAVPAKMMFDSERVISEGKIFKFQLDPIDPNDPFRGKYMTLRFKENELRIDSCHQLGYLDAFVEIYTGHNGLARIKDIHFDKPGSDKNFLKAQVYCDHYKQFENRKENLEKSYSKYVITYPFKRYYMNEVDIEAAEKKLGKILRDTTRIAYGEVSIKHGQSRLTALKVDDMLIQDFLH